MLHEGKYDPILFNLLVRQKTDWEYIIKGWVHLNFATLQTAVEDRSKLKETSAVPSNP